MFCTLTIIQKYYKYVPQSGESNKKLAEQQNFKKLKAHSQPTCRFNNETQNSIYKVSQVI